MMKVLTSSLLLISTSILANEPNIKIQDNQILHWQNMPGAYGKYAVLAGNPKNHELFVVRIKFPAHHTIKPHHHLNYEYDTVIAGHCYIAEGKNSNQTNGRLVKAGGFVIIPPNMPHYGWTTNEAAIIQVSGMGPWKPVYEDVR